MGNITAIIVVCSVCGFLILVLLFAYIKVSKKSLNNKLDEKINKYKQMNEGYYAENDNSENNKKNKKELKKEKKEQKVISKKQKLQEKVLGTVNTEKLEENFEENVEYKNNLEQEQDQVQNKSERYNPFDENEKLKIQKKPIRDDFDEFMNEFSYSRAAMNKNLLKQIEKLPPKVKALVLGNIFNKFDD